MSKLILTRGIQASGKSSWARAWVLENPDHRVRVNRDDLRRMLFATTNTLLDWSQEQTVSKVEKAIAVAALEAGKDVVVDAMNLRARWVREWFTLGYSVEFQDFPVMLDEALARNAQRGTPIPNEVLSRTFARLTDKGRLRPPPTVDAPTLDRYAPDWNLPGAFLFDIDGTLAHMTGRSPYDFTRAQEDMVDESVAYLLRELKTSHAIVIMSGREETCRVETEAWLLAHNIPYDVLLMRAEGDARNDSTVKTELFNTHVRHRYNVHGVIDDRNSVVRMWRDLGLKCYQAQEGAF